MDYQGQGVLYVKYEQQTKDMGFNLQYAKPGDVGLDLPVVMSKDDPKFKITPHRDYLINWEEKWFDIPAHGMAEVPCGLSVKVPDDAWANIKPRSSTGWKRRLLVYEGVIDSQYVGPLYILVQNPNSSPARIHEGDKLAQLIIMPKYNTYYYEQLNSPMGIGCHEKCTQRGIGIEQAEQLPETVRGATGFGSSGK